MSLQVDTTFLSPMDLPAVALAECARRHGVRCSTGAVVRRCSSTGRQISLQGIVAAAESLGLRARPARGSWPSLHALTPAQLPAILVFTRGTRTGFGVLEGVSESGARVWDSSSGHRTVSLRELQLSWSGVLLLFERANIAVKEQNYLLRRICELVFDGSRFRTDLVGRGSTIHARCALATVALTLLAAVVLTQAPEHRGAVALELIFLSIGLLASLVSSIGQAQRARASLCGIGPFDCRVMAKSRYAKVAGVPLSDIGISIFGALFLMVACSLVDGGRSGFLAAGIVALAGAPFSFALLVALGGIYARTGKTCAACIAAHCSMAAISAIAILHRNEWRDSASGVGTALLGFGALALLLMLGLVPLLRDAPRLDELERRLERAPSSGLGTLAELMASPEAPVVPANVGVRLGRRPGAVGALALVNPACGVCDAFLDELEALDAVRGEQLETFLAVAPIDSNSATDVSLCIALTAAALDAGAPALRRCLRAVKVDPARFAVGDPYAEMAAVVGVSRTDFEAHRVAARQRVFASSVLRDRHTDGLPALFVAARPCEASLSQVEEWLQTPALFDALCAVARFSNGAKS